MNSLRPALIPAAIAMATLAGPVAAQSIDMSQVQTATLSAEAKAAAVDSRASQAAPHAQARQWTRISMTTDAQGNPRAVCSVEKAPWTPNKVHPIHTNQPSRK